MSVGKQNAECSYLPSCWEDEVRMKALFSAFRKKDLNPTGWQEKMDFWVNAINTYCKNTKHPIISAQGIRNAFEKDKRYPCCIDDVLGYMLNEQLISTSEDFNQAKNQGWLNWGFDTFVKTPVSWGFSTVKGMLFEQQKETKFVNLAVVEALSELVLQKHAELVELEKSDYIVDFQNFKLQCREICEGEHFDCVVTHLLNHEDVTMLIDSGKRFIKFKDEIHHSTPAVSEADTAIIKLRGSLQLLSNNVDSLEKEISNCTNTAKQCLREGSKPKAVAMLKKRKRLEKELERKATSMDNMETLLTQLKNTASEKQVIQAYNAGVIAMKSCLSNELDLNKIDTTMADLEEMADDFNELESILAKGIRTNADVDDDEELELELDEIMANEYKERDVVEEDTDDVLMRRLERLRMPFDKGSVSPPERQSNVPRASEMNLRSKQFAQ